MSCSSKRNRLVGSCISTFVSSTNSLASRFFWDWRDFFAIGSGEAGGGSASIRSGSSCGSTGRSECFSKVEYLLCVSGHLDPAPFAREGAALVDHERAALDAAYFAAVHVLHLDHAEQRAGLLFRVAEQVERKLHLRLEAFVRFQRVARDAEDQRARTDELLVQVAKLHSFGRAPRRVVPGVEIQHDVRAAQGGEAERAAGRGEGKVLYGFSG